MSESRCASRAMEARRLARCSSGRLARSSSRTPPRIASPVYHRPSRANYKTDDRSFIDASFSPQDYGVATKKGSELSAKVEELITGWLADGTIDAMIAEWGL